MEIYDVIERGKYPIDADLKKWRPWEIRRYNRKFQLMLTTPIIDNETQYVSVGLTYKMIRAFLLEMTRKYGIEKIENDLGIKIEILDIDKWKKSLIVERTERKGSGDVTKMWN